STGEVDGVGGLPGPPFDATVDSNGRYWMAFFRHPLMVFDQEGRFIREVGSIGDGPGELANPYLLDAVGDSVVVFEVARRRLTVFGPDFRFVRSLQFPLRPLEVATFRWPAVVMMN